MFAKSRYHTLDMMVIQPKQISACQIATHFERNSFEPNPSSSCKYWYILVT